MAKNTRGSRSSSGGTGKVLMAFILGAAVAVGAGYGYLHRDALLGRTPQPRHTAQLAPAAPRPIPVEKHPAKTASEGHEKYGKRTPPFGTSEDVYEAGAHIYRKDCASCHGVPGQDATTAAHTNPAALQLWRRRSSNIVGVSAEAPGEIYGKIAFGVHASGMPAYEHLLTQTQMWQVSLLLANAGTELPNPVMQILTAP